MYPPPLYASKSMAVCVCVCVHPSFCVYTVSNYRNPEDDQEGKDDKSDKNQ